MEGGGHDEEVASSKKTNSRLERKIDTLFITTMTAN